MRFNRLTGALLVAMMVPATAYLQHTNPVSTQQTTVSPVPHKTPGVQPEGGDGEVVVYSDKQTVEGEKGHRIVRHVGNVDVRYGIYRLQADEIAVYEAESKIVAKGSV